MRLRYFVFGILLVFSTIVKSQTLKETEDWIKQKFDEYEYSASGHSSYNGNPTFWTLRFTYVPNFSKKGELWITENKFNNPPGETNTSLYIIPIKYMNSVKYQYQDDCVFVLFSVKNEDLFSERDNIKFQDFKSQKIENTMIQFAIKLANSFKDNDMPNRFKKALDHLIELNGGKVVKDVF